MQLFSTGDSLTPGGLWWTRKEVRETGTVKTKFIFFLKKQKKIQLQIIVKIIA